MGERIRLQEFSRVKARGVLVDANVLLYLFWSTGQYVFESNYASVFRNLLRQGNTLYTDFLIISEVVNRAIRTEYEKYLLLNNFRSHNYRFKEFRSGNAGKEAIEGIYITVKTQILTRFEVAGVGFSKMDIDAFLMVDTLDFVDKALERTCMQFGWVLLTNDRDFKHSDIDILSANPQIFSQ